MFPLGIYCCFWFGEGKGAEEEQKINVLSDQMSK